MERTKEKTRKRVVNFRSFVVIAVSVVLSILSVRLALNIPALGFSFFGIILFFLLNFMIFYIVKLKKPDFKLFRRKKLEATDKELEIKENRVKVKNKGQNSKNNSNLPLCPLPSTGCTITYKPDPKQQRKTVLKITTFALAILLSVAAGLNFYLTLNLRSYAEEDRLVLISGRIDNISMEQNRFLLDDLVIDGYRKSGRLALFTDFIDLDFFLKPL